jgi:hypothetical protein
VVGSGVVRLDPHDQSVAMVKSDSSLRVTPNS